MRVRLTPIAERHLRAIASYVRQRSPAATRGVIGRIREATELLREFPDIGHDGALASTREFVVPGLPYIIVYRVDDGGVLTLLGVYHGAQVRPGQDQPAND